MSSVLLLGLLVSACLIAAGWLAHMHYAKLKASPIRPQSEEERLRALFAQQRELDRQRLERTGEPIILQPLESSYQLWRDCLDQCGLYRARPCPHDVASVQRTLEQIGNPCDDVERLRSILSRIGMDRPTMS